MRDAVIGLFPGQVLKDKERGDGDGRVEAARGRSQAALPRAQLGAEARAAELPLAGKCLHRSGKGWKVWPESSHRREDRTGNWYKEEAQPLYFPASLWGSDRKNLLFWQGREREEMFTLAKLRRKFLLWITGETSPSSLPGDERKAQVSKDRPSKHTPFRGPCIALVLLNLSSLAVQSFSSSSIEPWKQLGRAVTVSAFAAEDTLAGSELTQLQWHEPPSN